MSICYTKSIQLNSECTWKNEKFNKWKCGCIEKYEMIGWKCELVLSEKIQLTLPKNSILRDFSEIESNTWYYIGIYIKNPKIWEELSSSENMPYMSCPEEVEWQGITWEYHVFTYSNGNKIWDITIWWIWYGSNGEISLSFKNTNINNFRFFWGNKPNEWEEYNIEISKLINLKDFTWDGIKNEFLLINHYDQVCWHNNYLVIWFDQDSKKPIIYWIDGWKNWEDNFIPNEKWEVVNWIECGDHWSWIHIENRYIFSSKEQIYKKIKTIKENCKEW